MNKPSALDCFSTTKKEHGLNIRLYKVKKENESVASGNICSGSLEASEDRPVHLVKVVDLKPVELIQCFSAFLHTKTYFLFFLHARYADICSNRLLY